MCTPAIKFKMTKTGLRDQFALLYQGISRISKNKPDVISNITLKYGGKFYDKCKFKDSYTLWHSLLCPITIVQH